MRISKMVSRRLGRGLMAVTFLPVLGCPAPLQAHGLEDVLVHTYETNPQIEADRARQRSVDEDVARAVGGWRPVLSFTGETGRGHDVQQFNTNTPRPTSISETRTPEVLLLQLQQMIYDGGRISADIRHAELVVESGLAVMVSTEQLVLGQATQAYYDLYRDQEIVNLEKGNVEWLEKQVKATAARYKVKDVTQTDVAQAEASLAKGQADQTAAQGNLDITRSGFSAVTGLPPDLVEKPPEPPRALLPPTLEEAQMLAESSPDMVAAKLAEQAAEADVDAAESGLMPTLSLRGTISREDAASQGNYNIHDKSILLSLNVPLYEGGVAAARTRTAKQVVGQRRLEIDNARRKAVDQANRAWQSLMTARSSIRALTQQVRAAEVAVRSIQAETRVGARTLYDQLLAQQDLVNAQIGLTRARRDEAVATYNVLQAIGRLTATGLSLPVQVYDPSVHYQRVRNRPFGTGIDESYERPPQ